LVKQNDIIMNFDLYTNLESTVTFEKKVLKETFQSMENCKPLHQKYVSAKATVLNWMKTRLEKQATNNPATTQKPYVATA